jgi:hypothetical protein
MLAQLTGLRPRTADLKGLFLNGAKLDLLSSANPRFPSLEVLGLYNVDISHPTSAAECLPMLRHVAYENTDGRFDGKTATFLTRLAPQLHSVTFVSDIHLTAISKVPSLQACSILVNLPWTFWDSFTEGTTQTVCHLRLLVANAFGSADDSPTCDEVIATLASNLELRLPSLESIYLPPLNSLPVNDSNCIITTSLGQLAQACQARKIEVVFEEQSDGNRAENWISEDFMKRTTKKRIESEA